MTEDETKTKWCPFVRYANSPFSNNATANRWKQSEPADQPHALNPVPCRCIGSDCMAWRWRDREPIPSNDPMYKPPRGFCGLAGKP